MKKLDLRTQHRTLYAPPASRPVLVDVPELLFLAVDGQLEPGLAPGGSLAFREAVQALFAVSFTIRFSVRFRAGEPVDYPVMPLEALWWSEAGALDLARPVDWSWRAMLLQPPLVTPALLADALATVAEKRQPPSPAALQGLKLLRLKEGLCVQMLHLGPHATEGETRERMLALAEAKGLSPREERRWRQGALEVWGHHEVYLGDPRRTAPERLRTVLRQPLRAREG